MVLPMVQQACAGLCGPAHASTVYLTAAVPRLATRSITEAAATLDRDQLMQRTHQLETAAAEAHKAAQELNKQGRYQEAAEMYARMRKLDAEALDAAQELGCPSCRVSAADRETLRGSSDCTSSSAVYQQLHTPAPWPLLSDPVSMSERAIGGIVGCLVADAAAMPVQWIYDLAVIDDLLAHRQQVI
eukprot:GHUV01029757.1.p1 GENE.GHUV01029757.1~~GHUV01029757.1.p1  ORF type:complete len:187 (+),score=34.99 GHUV01029757.1:417-977(+)